jgi:hypothetical protein
MRSAIPWATERNTSQPSKPRNGCDSEAPRQPPRPPPRALGPGHSHEIWSDQQESGGLAVESWIALPPLIGRKPLRKFPSGTIRTKRLPSLTPADPRAH